LVSCKAEDEILGCTDSAAFNYNPSANTDDGSCEPIVYGCIYECSENYNPNANTDDGSCILDRDSFFGTYEIFSECIGQPNFNDTVNLNFIVTISADSSDFCKIIRTDISTGNSLSYFVSGDSIIIPYSTSEHHWFVGQVEVHGGTAVLANDTIVVYTYHTVSGSLISHCDEIWVRQ
jgi:hypothetical protein